MNPTDKQDAPYADFGRRLVKLRKAAGFNRSQFAKACGTGISTMQYYEAGLRMPQGDVLYNMAQVLRITLDELMDPEEQLADRLEEELGKATAETLSKRQKARMDRSLKEARQVLFAGGLSPTDRQGYILTMQRMVLDAMEENAKKYSTATPWSDERHQQFDSLRKHIDDTADEIEASRRGKDD
ncbi:MAG: helix-turn-helix transcriptional regulator [Selenomonadaceae bacterium]|nr:helix-turn-helix transcriptional regulator [Selenomonadaceae bacterium]